MTERRPRIALVTDAIFPYHHGGKEVRTHELARRLARYGDVHVYTMKWWDGPRVRIDDRVTFHAITPRIPLYLRGRRSVLQALVFAVGCLGLAFARFDVLEADHIPYWQLLTLRLVTLVRGKRFVVTWHESWGAEYWRSYLGLAGCVGWWLERVTMRLPDAIIAASSHTATRLGELLGPGANVFVAPNGIDLECARQAEASPGGPDLVCVGRLLSHKRIDLLIDAVARLRDEGLSVTCRVIGNGPERERLEAQAQTLGVHRQITFGGAVATQAALFSELKAARLFVFPSEREGFGIAVLEALACGLPVVTTSAPHNMARHLVSRSEHGIVCEPDPDRIAQAIRAAFGHDRPRVSDDRWLSEFDWDAIADRVAGVVLA